MSSPNVNKARQPDGGDNASLWEDINLLIRECIAGNRAAQKALYNKYAPQVYSIIRRYTAHTEIADEILNDSFFKIFTKIESYTGAGSFEGWMKRVVVNTVTDHMRKHIRNREVYHAAEMPEDVYVSDDIVGKLSYKELLAVIQALPEMQRTIFNLFVFEDYKHKDIAHELSITEVNSRWYLNDARNRLKEMINSIMNS